MNISSLSGRSISRQLRFNVTKLTRISRDLQDVREAELAAHSKNRHSSIDLYPFRRQNIATNFVTGERRILSPDIHSAFSVDHNILS